MKINGTYVQLEPEVNWEAEFEKKLRSRMGNLGIYQVALEADFRM
jgi:hypothetical protein